MWIQGQCRYVIDKHLRSEVAICELFLLQQHNGLECVLVME